MKWFKHLTNVRNDPAIIQLRAKYGIKAYAWWMLLLEAVAEKITPEHPIAERLFLENELCSLFQVRKKQLKEILKDFQICFTSFGVEYQNKINRKSLEDDLQMIYKQFQNHLIINIKIPKLLKMLDNYSKNLQVTNKFLASKEVDIDIDIEKEKENYKKEKESLSSFFDKNDGEGVKQHTQPKSKTTPKSKITYSDCFLQFWFAYPRKVGKASAYTSFLNACKKHNLTQDALLDKCLQALQWQTQTEQWLKNNGSFIPHPTTYLNQARWEDSPTNISNQSQQFDTTSQSKPLLPFHQRMYNDFLAAMVGAGATEFNIALTRFLQRINRLDLYESLKVKDIGG